MPKVPAVREDLSIYSALDDAPAMNSATINLALASIGATERSLLLEAVDRAGTPGNWNADADVTVPANVTLKKPPSGLITVQNGVTWTQNGPVDAGAWQVWDTSPGGTVVFASGVRKQAIWTGGAPDFDAGSATIFTTPATDTWESGYVFPAYPNVVTQKSIIRFSVFAQLIISSTTNNTDGIRITMNGVQGPDAFGGATVNFNESPVQYGMVFRGTGIPLDSTRIQWAVETILGANNGINPNYVQPKYRAEHFPLTTHDFPSITDFTVQSRKSTAATENLFLYNPEISVRNT